LRLSNTGNKPVNCWEKSDAEPACGGIYVEIQYYKALRGDNHPVVLPSVLSEILGHLSVLGLQLQLHGIRPSDVLRIKKKGPWVNFWDYLNEQLSSNWQYEEVY
jgi:hypothetical protein